jgi:putative heme-binding domain-containing protein
MRSLYLLTLLFSAALPHANGEDRLAAGGALFRSNCAFCHGPEGRGGRGPSLISARIVQNTTDDAMKSIVKSGIPGTGMPSFDLESDELDAVVAAVRHFSGGHVAAATINGDPAHGRAVYDSNGCAGCHRIGDAGTVFGPELERIGSMRSPEYLRESVANPSADIAPEFEGVTVVTREGKHLTGVRVNEDTFSIQLRLPNEQFVMFDKASLRSVSYLGQSLMPPYGKLPAKDLDDLVAYLAGLRQEASGTVLQEKGIR